MNAKNSTAGSIAKQIRLLKSLKEAVRTLINNKIAIRGVNRFINISFQHSGYDEYNCSLKLYYRNSYDQEKDCLIYMLVDKDKIRKIKVEYDKLIKKF